MTEPQTCSMEVAFQCLAMTFLQHSPACLQGMLTTYHHHSDKGSFVPYGFFLSLKILDFLERDVCLSVFVYFCQLKFKTLIELEVFYLR